jgi:pimeloyl-ACP methyl ester carboxylesterase
LKKKEFFPVSIPTLEGISTKTITSARLSTRVLFSGDDNGIPVVFVHGNLSSATFWEETMLALPAGYRGIAADNRGYGEADRAKKIDATRGTGDFADDLNALLDALNIAKAHVVGHSLGGSILWRFLMDYPQRLLTVTLVAPGSPFGYGGTKDLEGTPCRPDFAGSGAGVINPEFAKRVTEGDRSSEGQLAPRNIMNSFYWKPPFKPAREEELLSSMLSIHTGEDAYPGDFTPLAEFPYALPGVYGPNNSLSPKYVGDVSRLYALDPKPRILWIYGQDDQIVSDASLFDIGNLGKLGAVPGYPGEEVFPPQPMISQTRAVLERYKGAGGDYREVALAETGHTPYIEKPADFNAAFHAHLAG